MRQQGRADKSLKGGYKVEPKPKGVSPCEVSELGRALTYESYGKENIYEEGGPGYKPPGPRPAAAGPGGGRTIHRSGTQGRH